MKFNNICLRRLVAIEEYHCYQLHTQCNSAFFSQGLLHIHSKLLGIVSVELRVMSQVYISNCACVSWWRKIGTAIGQYISRLQRSLLFC